MRPLQITGRPSGFAPVEEQMRWVLDAIDQIVLASQNDTMALGDAFALANVPVDGLYVLDASTATLLQDMKKRGRFPGSG